MPPIVKRAGDDHRRRQRQRGHRGGISGRGLVKDTGRHVILADGPPGIACPFISSLAGADSGRRGDRAPPRDAMISTGLTEHFKIKTFVIINKYDLNPDQVTAIKADCPHRGLPVIANRPHDPAVTATMLAGKAVTEYAVNGISARIKIAWAEIQNHLKSSERKDLG